ncbi:MAG: hypothetical protein KGJ92_02495 [Actinomycetales bacterium]|nr:hypothetical protein [Actinomycetales bacterium]
MSHGLAPRPGPTPAELAAVSAAVALLSGSAVAAAPERAPAWRFSGRWFNAGRYANRRPIVNH